MWLWCFKYRSEPVCIQFLNGKRVVKIATGSQHTLALTAAGQVYSWGLNISGQLGHGDLSSSPVLIPVSIVIKIMRVMGIEQFNINLILV